MVLCLEKELRYDNPGRHDLKQQAMRINDSPASIANLFRGVRLDRNPNRVGRRFCPRGRIFPAQHPCLARGFAVFLYAGHMPL